MNSFPQMHLVSYTQAPCGVHKNLGEYLILVSVVLSSALAVLELLRANPIYILLFECSSPARVQSATHKLMIDAR